MIKRYGLVMMICFVFSVDVLADTAELFQPHKRSAEKRNTVRGSSSTVSSVSGGEMPFDNDNDEAKGDPATPVEASGGSTDVDEIDSLKDIEDVKRILKSTVLHQTAKISVTLATGALIARVGIMFFTRNPQLAYTAHSVFLPASGETYYLPVHDRFDIGYLIDFVSLSNEEAVSVLDHNPEFRIWLEAVKRDIEFQKACVEDLCA